MKKIVMILSVVLIAFMFVGCTASVPQIPVAKLEIDADKEPVDMSEYDKDFDGLIDFMKDNQLVGGSANKMSYDFIGAVDGCKFLFVLGGSQISCEFYEFDKEKMNEKATEVVESVKKDGTFMSVDTEVKAVLNESETFMMICVVSNADDASTKLAEDINTNFMAFK